MDESKANGELTKTSDHLVIEVLREKGRRDWLTSMEAKINQQPKLLKESAGKDSCSIFRVPQSMMEFNHNAYQPHIVSIGPYYHGKQHLQMIQEHKWLYLRVVLARTNTHGIGLDQLCQVVALREEAIRESYSETIGIDCHQLIEMMVLDGCFILELFRRVYQMEATDQDDPILKIAWVLPFIARDLLMLENQLPFFVLQTLFNKPILALGENNVPSLNNLALEFYRCVIGRPLEILERHEHVHGKHILDLFRLSLIPPPSQRSEISEDVNLIPSAEKLRRAGIKFKPRKSTESFVDIKFSDGVLQIPTLTLDDFSCSLLLNCVAFEQFHRHCSTDITTYATFMGCLINTAGDAGFLRDKKIIENYVGTDDQVALFFNNIGKDMATDICDSYLSDLFIDVNKYISKGWHVHWAEFKNTYFATRWSFISAIAASMLLILTMIQAFFAVYQYMKFPQNHI
ncbi:hypothetical protein COLO4_19963 [Corchorus olitorius]|uniref:Uncharacterized protein n=1 Tax=Corchorus olitorius TaxID=93759 RepID=A0A1R3J2K0_9ROSI|nr:hypothetical protein COLO4_19963 [Corchorus olitorius]